MDPFSSTFSSCKYKKNVWIQYLKRIHMITYHRTEYDQICKNITWHGSQYNVLHTYPQTPSISHLKHISFSCAKYSGWRDTDRYACKISRMNQIRYRSNKLACKICSKTVFFWNKNISFNRTIRGYFGLKFTAEQTMRFLWADNMDWKTKYKSANSWCTSYHIGACPPNLVITLVWLFIHKYTYSAGSLMI